jgi:hypothetical protein
VDWHLVILLFGVVIGITIASIGFITWKARRRSRSISQLAQELGLAYQADGSALLNDGLAELALFAIAALDRRATISNVITGSIAGASITACDFAYWTGSVNTQRFDYAQTVACFRLEPNRYPPFTLRPAGGLVEKASLNLAHGSAEMLTAIANPLAAKDQRWEAVKSVIEAEREDSIEIDGRPEFSQQYRLIGRDREAIKRLFSAIAFESLLQYEAHPLSVECSGLWLAIYRKNKQIKPDDMTKFLTQCVQLKGALLVHR